MAELWIDAEAPLSAFTLQAVQQIERLAPFGQRNARPLLCTTGVTLAEPPKPIGTGGRHLALRLSQHGVTLPRRGLRRRRVGRGPGRAADGPIDVAFRPVINTFQGRQNVELHLVDWRVAE